jgi:KTSC domain-containing protein
MGRYGGGYRSPSVKTEHGMGFETARAILGTAGSSKKVTPPRRQAVESSLLQSLGYRLTGNEVGDLYVRFLNTPDLFIYHQVPQSVERKLRAAKSIGGYFYEHVRSNYEYDVQKPK